MCKKSEQKPDIFRPEKTPNLEIILSTSHNFATVQPNEEAEPIKSSKSQRSSENDIIEVFSANVSTKESKHSHGRINPQFNHNSIKRTKMRIFISESVNKVESRNRPFLNPEIHDLRSGLNQTQQNQRFQRNLTLSNFKPQKNQSVCLETEQDTQEMKETLSSDYNFRFENRLTASGSSVEFSNSMISHLDPPFSREITATNIVERKCNYLEEIELKDGSILVNRNQKSDSNCYPISVNAPVKNKISLGSDESFDTSVLILNDSKKFDVMHETFSDPEKIETDKIKEDSLPRSLFDLSKDG